MLAGGTALAKGGFFAALAGVEEQSGNALQAAERFRASAAISIEAGRPQALSALEADAVELRREVNRLDHQLQRLEAQPPPEVPEHEPYRE